MTEKRVCLGKIVAAHGLRGEVKVHSYTDNPADIDKYGLVEDKEALQSSKGFRKFWNTSSIFFF